jgi:hypothetical protein
MTPNQINALHQFVRRHKPMPELCEECNHNPALDLANISPAYNSETYTRDNANWRYLCRPCHIKSDGRLAKMHESLWLKPRKKDPITGKFVKTVYN